MSILAGLGSLAKMGGLVKGLGFLANPFGAANLMGAKSLMGSKLFAGSKANSLSKFGELGNALGSAAAAGYRPYQATTVQGGSQASRPDEIALNAQRKALELTRANTGQGFNQAEKDNLNLGINRVNQNTAARSNALAQEQAARGLGGAGLGIRLRAQNEQTGANAASMQGVEAQNTANQRALSSIQQLGALGGDINDQAFNRGQAADALNMFNASAQNAAAAGNAGNQLQNNQFLMSGLQDQRNQGRYWQNARADRNFRVGNAALGSAGAVFGNKLGGGA